MTHGYGIPLEDERKLEVVANDHGFEFQLGDMWVNVHMHEPALGGWYEEKEDYKTLVRYYPEFSILVCQ